MSYVLAPQNDRQNHSFVKDMAKKWPGMVVQRTFIKEHSFVYTLYVVWENVFLFDKTKSIRRYGVKMNGSGNTRDGLSHNQDTFCL